MTNILKETNHTWGLVSFSMLLLLFFVNPLSI